MLASLAIIWLIQVRDRISRHPVNHQRQPQLGRSRLGSAPILLEPPVIHWSDKLPRYEIRELLAGPGITEPVRPTAINNRGDVIGTCGNSAILVQERGPAWRLDFGADAFRTKIDDRLQIGALIPGEFDAPSVAMRWTRAGGSKQLSIPSGVFPTAVEPNGDWLGTDHSQAAFRCFQGVETKLKPLEGFELAGGHAMTSQGWVVGGSYRRSGVDRALTFWKNPENPRRLPLPIGFRYFDRLLVSHDGTVAGMCWGHEVPPDKMPEGVFAFVSKDGKSSLIPFDRPVKRSEVRAISDNGQVLGAALVEGKRKGDTEALMWVYVDGRTYFLPDLLPRNSPWNPGQVYSINARGELAGTGGFGGVAVKGFVMSPPVGRKR